MDPTQDNGWGGINALASDVQTVQVDPRTRQPIWQSRNVPDPQTAKAITSAVMGDRPSQGFNGAARPTQPDYQGMMAALYSNAPTAPTSTWAHEVLGHGSLGRAEQTGQTGQLDTLGQLVAGAQQSSAPWIQGLGAMGDEARAFGLGRAYPAMQAGADPSGQNLAETRGALGDMIFNPGRAKAYSQLYRSSAAANPLGFRGYAGQTVSPDAYRDAANMLSVTGGIGNVVPVSQFLRLLQGQ